ncbi:S8 family serine peptidase [Streptomyces sp. 3214.6]|uniref:S8 family serine peptidase n=1 Tax=Streptomyces sp. 3214.6 TaxID=1882757 RepID=UPI0022B25CE4|nr:S8 family serine peptidase [Streptomyces sp. 3214.6]
MDTVAAIDRAVADGVDVINYSIGGDITHPTVKEAMFNAAKAGVFVAASAGNSGPGTVQITAPWLTTVAASTHDTDYTASLTLGNGRRITNRSLNSGVPSTPLVNAADVRTSDADAEQAALCAPGTLDPSVAAYSFTVGESCLLTWDRGMARVAHGRLHPFRRPDGAGHPRTR